MLPAVPLKKEKIALALSFSGEVNKEVKLLSPKLFFLSLQSLHTVQFEESAMIVIQLVAFSCFNVGIVTERGRKHEKKKKTGDNSSFL